MSNSKLTSTQKQFRKWFIAKNPGLLFYSFPEMGVTVAIRETGMSMAEFSVSIASDTEQKFRRKVGEYTAIKRIIDGQVLPVVKWSDNLGDIAEKIADSVSGNG